MNRAEKMLTILMLQTWFIIQKHPPLLLWIILVLTSKVQNSNYFTYYILHFLNQLCIVHISSTKLCRSYSELEYNSSSSGLMFLFATSFTLAVESTKLPNRWVAGTLINTDIKWPDSDKHSHQSSDEVKNMCNCTP
jgi:hypothetical protein